MLAEKLQEAAGNGIASTLYVDDVFSTWLYTGNGSTQTITNGIDLAGNGGMTWIKSRSAATDHKLTDTARGATKALISDTTGAQTTDTTGLTTFSSTGFSLGASSVYNTNAATYASWTFRKAAKFFDVVTYTGNGTARNIAHNLGVAPGMIIIKVTSTSNSWFVYHRSLNNNSGNPYFLLLQSTASQDTGGGVFSTPTSTTFGIRAAGDVNATGQTYVAYLFAHDTASDGIIQCGSYTGNGSTTGPVVSLGWEPQYLMVKNASGTGNWQILDSMRGMPVGSADATIQANLPDAESSIEYLSPTATGFQITSTSTEVNTSGATYIYMAIRRPNKPPTTGTQVFSPNISSGATGTVITTGFPVDLQLVEARSIAANTFFTDRLRGISSNSTMTAAALSSATTSMEYSSSTYGLNWDNTGFQMPSYWASKSDVFWNFKRAPGFMDVVCYTGTGVATTQAHNLTVVPEFMIVKERSAVNDWWVYSVTVGNTKYSVLNSTAVPVTSSTAWNNTTPTASVFSIGTGANVNASTQTYVAYLFATLAGISKVGSYTGNGTTQTINCGFTGGARFVLIKRTDSTGDWYVFDTARGMTTLTDPYLLLNSTAAEVATLGAVTSVTTGFAVNAAIVAAINTNAASYIFLAIA